VLHVVIIACVIRYFSASPMLHLAIVGGMEELESCHNFITGHRHKAVSII
jgi:hypothetical protein